MNCTPLRHFSVVEGDVSYWVLESTGKNQDKSLVLLRYQSLAIELEGLYKGLTEVGLYLPFSPPGSPQGLVGEEIFWLQEQQGQIWEEGEHS